MDIPSTNPALGGGEDTAAAAEQEQGQAEGSALPQGSKGAGKVLFTPLVPPQRQVLAALENDAPVSHFVTHQNLNKS